jgi:hypothetical protein
VTVFVHDNDLQPVTNYSLNLTPLGKDELEGTTFKRSENSSGAAELRLRENGKFIKEKYKLTVAADGFLSGEKVVTFPYCEQLVHEILLLKTGQARTTLSGKVFDKKGAPASYAKITFTGADQNKRHIDADIDGFYEVKLTPGDYAVSILTVRSVPLMNAKVTVPLSGKGEINFSAADEKSAVPKIISPPDGPVLRGVVVDEYGALIPDVNISLKNAKGKEYETATNSDGEYSVKVPAGVYSLDARYRLHAGWQPFRMTGVSLTIAEERIQDITLKTAVGVGVEVPGSILLPAAVSKTELNGTVRDTRGAAIGWVKLIFTKPDGIRFSVTADKQGKYKALLESRLIYTIQTEMPGFKSRKIDKYSFYDANRSDVLDLVIESAPRGMVFKVTEVCGNN